MAYACSAVVCARGVEPAGQGSIAALAPIQVGASPLPRVISGYQIAYISVITVMEAGCLVFPHFQGKKYRLQVRAWKVWAWLR